MSEEQATYGTRGKEGTQELEVVAELTLNHVGAGVKVGPDQKPAGREVKTARLDIREKGEHGAILTPSILLDGAFFQDWLNTGHPGVYRVTMAIKAVRTDLKIGEPG